MLDNGKHHIGRCKVTEEKDEDGNVISRTTEGLDSPNIRSKQFDRLNEKSLMAYEFKLSYFDYHDIMTLDENGQTKFNLIIQNAKK